MIGSNGNTISTTMKAVVIIVCMFGPLASSAMMGASFLAELGTGAGQWVLFLASVSLLASSSVLGTLAGRSARAGGYGVAAVCALAWLCIVVFSTSTSSLSLLDTSEARIHTEVRQSDAARHIDQSIRANETSISALRTNIGSAPESWLTKRGQWAAEISRLSAENAALAERKQYLYISGQGSTAAQAFDKLAAFGLTRTRLVVLFALSLDLVPFAASLALGFLSAGSRRRVAAAPSYMPVDRPASTTRSEAEADSGKKPQRPLRAVD